MLLMTDRFRSFASNHNDKEAVDHERESDDNNNDPKSRGSGAAKRNGSKNCPSSIKRCFNY
ncbi:hypothetical protein SESBI_37952 [Sesbania bispinosa]|nr:hypothetical protein SESBI_37952 [Sesbania bispinosa]